MTSSLSIDATRAYQKAKEGEAVLVFAYDEDGCRDHGVRGSALGWLTSSRRAVAASCA